MNWNNIKIKNHIKAAKALIKIKDLAFKYISDNNKVSEFDVYNYILNEFKKRNLKTDRDNCIVSFRENTSFVHYYPSQYCKMIKSGSLIMLDIWANFNKVNAPFADITWMAYKGKNIPREVDKAFKLIVKARDGAIKFIKKNLKNKNIPTGREIDSYSRKIIEQSGFGKNFKHNLGHSLGMSQPHGNYAGLTLKNNQPLKINVGYTIEPGIYFDNKFGIRSEIDFFINKKLELIITTPLQKNIKLI